MKSLRTGLLILMILLTLCAASYAREPWDTGSESNGFGRLWLRNHDFWISSWFSSNSAATLDNGLYEDCFMSILAAKQDPGVGYELPNHAPYIGLYKDVMLDLDTWPGTSPDYPEGQGKVTDTSSSGDDWSYYLRDEPGYTPEPPNLIDPTLKDAADWIRTNRMNALIHINLDSSHTEPASPAPWTGWPTDGSGNNYSRDQYILSTIKPDMEWWDYHPYITVGSSGDAYNSVLPWSVADDGEGDWWFVDQLAGRHSAQQYNIPYGCAIQSSDDTDACMRVSSESEMRMQVFSSLACGYKGLMYFGFDAPPGLARINVGLLYESGYPSDMYYYVQGINYEVRYLGEYLRFLECEDYRFILGKTDNNLHALPGVRSDGQVLPQWKNGANWENSHFDFFDSSYPPSGNPHITNITIGSQGDKKDGVIGFFTDDGDRNYFMLTNVYRGIDKSSKDTELSFTITFDNNTNTIYRINRYTGAEETISLTNHQYTVTLPGGTGDLFAYDTFDKAIPTSYPRGTIANEYTTSTSVTLDLTRLTANGRTAATHMRFRNRLGSWGSWETFASTKSWTLPSSQDGIYPVYVQYKISGTPDKMSASYRGLAYLDTTAPVPGAASSPAVATGTFTVTYSGASDATSGLKKVELWYKKDTGSWTNSGSSVTTSPSSGSFTFTPTSEGTYYFDLVAEDNAGNRSAAASGNGDDSTLYTPVIFRDNFDISDTNDINAGLSARQSGSVGTVQYEEWYGLSSTPTAATQTQIKSNQLYILPGSDGRVLCSPNYNFTGDTKLMITFKMKPPTATNDTVAVTVGAPKDQYWSGNSPAAGKGIGIVGYSIGQNQVDVYSSGSRISSHASADANADGWYDIKVTIDTPSWSGGTATVKVWVDNTLITNTTKTMSENYLTFQAESTTSGGYIDDLIVRSLTGIGADAEAPLPGTAVSPARATSSPITVTYSGAWDDRSGLKKVELWYKKESGGTWTNSGLNSTTDSGSFSFSPASGDGTYYFDLVAEDNVGNRSTAASGSGDCSTVYTSVTLFYDTFDSPDDTDVNADKSLRQYGNVTGLPISYKEWYHSNYQPTFSFENQIYEGVLCIWPAGSVHNNGTLCSPDHNFADGNNLDMSWRMKPPADWDFTNYGLVAAVFGAAEGKVAGSSGSLSIILYTVGYRNGVQLDIYNDTTRVYTQQIDDIANDGWYDCRVKINTTNWTTATASIDCWVEGLKCLNGYSKALTQNHLTFQTYVYNDFLHPYDDWALVDDLKINKLDSAESTAPSAGTLSTPPSTASTSPIQLTYSGASDSGSGLKAEELWFKKESGGNWTYSGLSSSLASDTFNFVPPQGNGTYYFALVAEDNACNRSTAPSGDGAGSTVYTSTYLFIDNFTTSDTSDINADLSSRQEGSLSPLTYDEYYLKNGATNHPTYDYENRIVGNRACMEPGGSAHNFVTMFSPHHNFTDDLGMDIYFEAKPPSSTNSFVGIAFAAPKGQYMDGNYVFANKGLGIRIYASGLVQFGNNGSFASTNLTPPVDGWYTVEIRETITSGPWSNGTMTATVYINGNLEWTVTGKSVTENYLTFQTEVNSSTDQGYIRNLQITKLGCAGDSVAPTPGTASSPATATTRPIHVTYSGASDATSGLRKVELWYKKNSGGAWTNSGLSATTPSGAFDFPQTNAGTYYFDLVAEDNAGNRSATPTGSGDDSTEYSYTIFSDNFNAANTDTINNSLTARQSGDVGLVQYDEWYSLSSTPTAAGQTQIKSNQLYILPGSDGRVLCSPNYNFTGDNKLQITFKMKPPTATNDTVAVTVGAPKDQFYGGNSPAEGKGIGIRGLSIGQNQVNVYSNGSSIITHNTADDNADGWYDIKITIETSAWDGSQATVNIWVDNVLITTPNPISKQMWENYLTFQAESTTSGGYIEDLVITALAN